MKFDRLLLLLLLSPVITWSQDYTAKTNLKDVLSALANKHGVQFSYVDEVINGKSVDIDTSLSISESIVALELASRLRFETLNEDYIVIRNYRPDDKVSLCGMVSDYNQNPLLGVSIGYSSTEGVFTGEGGAFKLDSIPYDSWLTLRYVGYSTKKLKVSRLSFKECIPIKMAESIEELKEIVVIDYLAAGISKVKNSVQLNPHTLKTLAGLAEPDILQSIQQVPGVNSPFETAAGIHVRGGLPDQNLILWNGIKTYNHGHFFGMISAFNPYITDKVEFIKNGTPARYGDRISSVIDITSSNNVSNKLSGGVGTNLLYADGYLNIPLVDNKLSVQLSGRRSFTDVFSTPTYSQISDRVFQNTKIGDVTSDDQQAENSFYFTDFSANSIWQINSNNKLIFNSLYNRNRLDFESESDIANQSFNDQLLHANEGANLQWIGNLSDKFTVDLNGSYSRYILRYDFIQTVSDTITQSSKKNYVEESAYQFNGDYTLNSDSRIKLGYHLSDVRIRYAYETESPSYQIILDSDNSTVQTHSGYFEYLFENDQYTVQPGIRFNYYNQLNEQFFEPRLYVQKRFPNNIALSLSGEYRTQIASQIKESVVSDLSLENKVWALASPNRFPVLTSFQISSGISYRYKEWFAELEGYRKALNGVTTLIFGYLNGLENQFREGDSQIHGADLLVKRTWDSYESWISYSYIRTQNTFDDINDNQSFPGSWSIEHTIRWSNIVNINDWEFSLGWLWHTGKSFTDVSTLDAEGGPVQIFYDELNANNLPVYHRMDMSVMKEFGSAQHPNLRYRLGLSVLNVYNKKNLLNREFRTTPSLENELIDTRVYSLGITPNLVFRVFW